MGYAPPKLDLLRQYPLHVGLDAENRLDLLRVGLRSDAGRADDAGIFLVGKHYLYPVADLDHMWLNSLRQGIAWLPLKLERKYDRYVVCLMHRNAKLPKQSKNPPFSP